MYGQMIPYRLSAEELELARQGKYDQIPTAAQRGLLPTITDPPKTELVEEAGPLEQPPVKQHGRKGVKYSHITKEFLQAERDAGKTIEQICADNGIVRGTISWMLKKYGLSSDKRGPKSKEK